MSSLYVRGARVLWRTIRLHRVPFSLSLLGTMVFAATSVLGTVALGDVTDRILIPALEEGEVDTGTVVAGVAVLVGLSIARTIGVVFRRFFAGMTAARMQRTLREELAERYVRMPLADHRRQSTGKLLSHADTDVERATEMLNPLPFSIGAIAFLVFSLLSLALVDVWMLLVGVVAFPIVALVNRVYVRNVVEPAARVQALTADVADIVHESYTGALVVKTLGREEAEVGRLRDTASSLEEARRRVGSLRARFEPTMQMIPNAGIVLLVAVGAWRIDAGAISTGELVQAVALFQLLAFPLAIIGWLLQQMASSVVAHDRLDDVLGATTDVDPLVGSLGLSTGPLAIEIEALRFGFDEGGEILHGVDLVVRPGEVLALVGSTGSGKSTLVQLVAGLELPTAGVVRLGGVPVPDLLPDDRASAVGLAFQVPFLFAASVRDNVVLGRSVDDAELGRVLAISNVDRFLDDLPDGLDTVVGERGVTLSGGQRQRVALARSLVGMPRVLLLDDATSAIDPTVETDILLRLRASLRATTLVVAQRRSTIALADRVAFLQDGRIVATGTHDELLATVPAYEALVRAYEREAVG
ncbi:MAG: ABC transporter ATP-binding protein [Actinomycetota bacterium]